MIGTTNVAPEPISLEKDIVPAMTSPNMDTWKSSVSSIYANSSDSSWQAFNKDISGNSYWHSAVPATSGWIQIESTNYKMNVHNVTMYSRVGYGSARMPKVWHLQGSNDGNIFYNIYDATSCTPGATYAIPKYADWYSHIRIKIDSINSGDCINIGEVKLIGRLKPI